MRKSIYLILIIIAFLLLWNFLPQKAVVPEKVRFEDNFNRGEFDYFNFKSDYIITVKNCKNALLSVSVYLPENISEKQISQDINFSVQPSKIYYENNNKIALFEIKNPDKQTVIEIKGQVGVITYDFNRALSSPLPEELSLSDRQKYTSPEKFIESDDETIIKMAKELSGADEIQTVKNIYTFVQQYMRYSTQHETIGAKEMLKKKRGRCTDYAMLMVALCRANNISSRVVSGIIISDEPQNHTWVEVWFDKYGWVTFEPTIISNLHYDFKQSPHKYLTLGKDITSSVVVKLKVSGGDNRPRPDVVLALEEHTEFSEAAE